MRCLPMRTERVVVDINVLISAVLQPSGRTAKALEVIQATGGVILFSDKTFARLTLRLMRPKFDCYVDQNETASQNRKSEASIAEAARLRTTNVCWNSTTLTSLT